MSVVFAVLALAVIAAGVLLVLKRPGAPVLTEPVHDRAVGSLPEGPIGAAELRGVRFPVAFRGYRMEDVDALLARLESQLDAGHSAPTAYGARPQAEIATETDAVASAPSGQDLTT